MVARTLVGERTDSCVIGYMMNTYPVPSGTFIKNEILEHENNGFLVRRYSARSWEGALVDSGDESEAEKTKYILKVGYLKILTFFIIELLSNPLGVLKCMRVAFKHSIQKKSNRFFPFFYVLEAAVLKRWSIEDNVSHIHAHFSTNAASIAMFCRFLGGPTYSFTVHGPDELPEMRSNGIVEKVSGAKFVVAITEFAKSKVVEAVGSKVAVKVKVVFCGVDLSLFPKSPLDADVGGRLLCVGRLCPQKAQTMLVRAVIDLLEQFPELSLDLIGDGETRKEIEALISDAGASDRVRLLGWGSAGDVRAAMMQSRAFVLPSFAEGLPIVLMEAFAMTRPVISTRIAGIPELLDGSCGWIFEPGDSGALSDAITEALKASIDELRSLGAEGRRRVEERHDVSVSAARLREEFFS